MNAVGLLGLVCLRTSVVLATQEVNLRDIVCVAEISPQPAHAESSEQPATRLVIDGTSRESFNATTNAITSSLAETNRRPFRDALIALQIKQRLGDKPPSPENIRQPLTQEQLESADAAVRRDLHGKTADEVIKLAEPVIAQVIKAREAAEAEDRQKKLKSVWPWGGPDHDNDLINDEYEREIIERFKIIVKTDRADSIRPISIADAFNGPGSKCATLETKNAGGGWSKHSESAMTFWRLAEVTFGHDMSNSKVWSCRNWEEINYVTTKFENQPDLFCKVSWVNLEARILSLQMYWFCTYNEADAPRAPTKQSPWDHDGDWLGVQLRIDCAKQGRPAVTSALFYNHDRILEGPREVLTFEGERLVVFAEHNTNEAWPCPGAAGEDFQVHIDRDPRWKCVPGFDCNLDITVDLVVANFKFPRGYSGKGAKIDAWRSINVGEDRKHTLDFVPETRLFFSDFRWGKRSGGQTSLPDSPPNNARMWNIR